MTSFKRVTQLSHTHIAATVFTARAIDTAFTDAVRLTVLIKFTRAKHVGRAAHATVETCKKGGGCHGLVFFNFVYDLGSTQH
ncbi:hypothetical protein [Rhodoferax antarcticus]|uniref:hypothetical protein n=1 Tax=Rhodoferax antarcticus TaxID=81479 RepID=UPI000AAF6A77|nr:hypothetical protein [Rhodoferax antarcticus]